MNENSKSAAFPMGFLLTPLLCWVLASQRRCKRWFDLDVWPWQESWRGREGKAWGELHQPSGHIHQNHFLPVAHAHRHACTHARTKMPHCLKTCDWFSIHRVIFSDSEQDKQFASCLSPFHFQISCPFFLQVLLNYANIKNCYFLLKFDYFLDLISHSA